MKENKLYAHIVYTLYNIFKDDKIKAQIVVSPELKKLVVLQICSLLTLEKEFEGNLKEQKYAVVFAQVLADITTKSETIEKIDGATFNTLDEDYVGFVQYLVNNFKVEKADITKENEISADLIDATGDFANEDAIKIAEEELKLQNNPAVSDSKKMDGGKQIPPIFMGGFGNASKIDMGQMMQQMSNIPIHPRLDPRFYPYTSKPKYMPTLKKIVAGIVITSSILFVILWVLMSYLNISLSVKIVTYTLPNGSFIIVGGGADSSVHLSPLFSSAFDYGTKFKFTLLQSTGLGVFSGLVPIIPGVFMLYDIVGKKRFKREIYIVRLWPVIISVIALLYSSFSLIQVLLPNFVFTYFSGFAVPSGGYKVGIAADANLDLTGGLLLPDSDIKATLDALTEGVKSSSVYKMLQTFMIIAMIVGIAAGIAAGVLAILAPRLDRNKLILANTEYQKVVTAMMTGEKCEMDQSLFDDEFKEDDTNQKKSSNEDEIEK